MKLTNQTKYVGPTVKSDRNLIGPIKPTFFSDQMSAIVQDRISVFTDVHSRFPRVSFVAWFPVKLKLWFQEWITLRRPFCGKRGRLILLMGQCVRNQKYEANRVERTLTEQWKTRRPWLWLIVLWHTCMHEQYDPGGCIRAKHVWNWFHEKKGLSCARPRKNASHISSATQEQGHKSCELLFKWRNCMVQYNKVCKSQKM